MQIMPRSPWMIAALWLVSFCSMATFIGLTGGVSDLMMLRREHAETSGEVIRLHPENHGVVDVKYVVAGTPYQGTFFPYLQDGRIVKGESVRVYYSPHDPTIAFIAPPEEILGEDLPFWLVASLLGSFAVTAGVLILWRKAAPIAKAVLGRR
jgi:hypothetical protein